MDNYPNSSTTVVETTHTSPTKTPRPNIVKGALAGAVAATAGAAIWAIITFITNFQIGLMAIALGCIVGFAVKQFGNGTTKVFGIVSATEALIGCLGGNLLALCAAISKDQGIPFIDIIFRLTPDLATSLMVKTFDGMDLIFYGIAVYEAYKFSFQAPIALAPTAKTQEK